MYIENKIILWERREIPEQYEEEVLRLFKEGKATEIDDLYRLINGFESEDLQTDQIWDTAEDMTVEENSGSPTIEIHSNDNGIKDTILWDNGRQEEK